MHSNTQLTATSVIREATDTPKDIYLQYTVFATHAPILTDDRYSTVYSLLVVKSTDLDDTESFFMYDITRSYDEAQRLLNTLEHNTVTPCTAAEILEEII